MKSKIATLVGASQLFAVAVSAEYMLTDGSKVAPLEVFQECNACPEMIALPLGEFLMGGPRGESRRNFHFEASGRMRPATPDDPYIAHHEGPVHPVVIDLPFAMGRNEITRDEWIACVDDGGCDGYIPEDFAIGNNFERIDLTGSHPVNDVSYLDALAYTKWLNKTLGIDAYRLPLTNGSGMGIRRPCRNADPVCAGRRGHNGSSELPCQTH